MLKYYNELEINMQWFIRKERDKWRNGSAYWLYFQHLSWLLSPWCVAAEMQDAEGFGAVEEIWADEENEEEFSAAPEWENEV